MAAPHCVHHHVRGPQQPRKLGLNTFTRTIARRRPVQCPHHHRAFSHVRNQNAHMSIHSRAEPYTCRYCPRRFRTSSNLIVHTRWHMDQFEHRAAALYRRDHDPRHFERTRTVDNPVPNMQNSLPPGCNINGAPYKILLIPSHVDTQALIQALSQVGFAVGMAHPTPN